MFRPLLCLQKKQYLCVRLRNGFYCFMKKVLFAIITVLCGVLQCPVSAQTSAAQADQLFDQQNYKAAAEVYQQLLRRQPERTFYLYRYARCLQEQGQNAEAIRYFEAAGERYPLRNFYLGELYAADYRFADAVEAYQRYLAKADTTSERYAVAVEKTEQAQKGLRYIKRVENIQLTDSVVVDKSVFLTAYPLSKSAGTVGMDDSLGYYINERQDVKLSTSTDYTLLSCQRLLEGEWMCDTLRLPSFAAARCNFPYMLSDGVTVYFASDVESGLGGYDIYITQYNTNTNTYLPPENIGMPFNSPANDYMFVIDDVKGIGYFATDRYMDSSKVCIYSFIPNEEKQIVRDTTDEYVRLFAQGKVLQHKTETPKQQETVVETKPSKQEVKMKPFVVNDSVVYTQLSDFPSIDARVLYEEYLRQEAQLEELKQTIATKRAAFRHADEATQQQLRTELLELEKQYLQDKQSLPELLHKVYEVCSLRVF